jgi:AcrR family transcriptional regulator
VVRVAAGKGYLACSVADILKAAGVGRESFYRHFSDKEDCFIAANDMLVDNLERRVAEAYEEPGTWTERVRCSLAATLAWLAANPDVARVMIIEMGTVGPIASVRFGQTLTRLTAVLDDCPDTLGSAPGLPNIASIAAGAVFASVYDKVVSGNTAELAELLPQLTYELLLPYVGDEAASAERAMATEQAEL